MQGAGPGSAASERMVQEAQKSPVVTAVAEMLSEMARTKANRGQTDRGHPRG